MFKALLLLVFLVVCFHINIGNGNPTLITDMILKATVSALIIVVALSCFEKYGAYIAIIEIISLLVIYGALNNWSNTNPLVTYYGHIQNYAYYLELLILIKAVLDGLVTYCKTYRDRLHHRGSDRDLFSVGSN